MSYGTSDQMQQMKFLGMEDFWGNLYQWTEGLLVDENGNALVATNNFNDTGEGYTNLGFIGTDFWGWMTAPQGNNDLGFVIEKEGGSSSTHFSDMSNFKSSMSPIFGGSFDDANYAGAFRLRMDYTLYDSNIFIGSRLMFL